MKINKIAVIGSGVMGAGIAAHIANAGTEVLLYDIAHNGENKNLLAEQAIEKLLTTEPPPFSHIDHIKYITPCNLEEHLHLFSNVDWVIEAVVENVSVKQKLYHTLSQYCRLNTIFSSNTSTITLKELLTTSSSNFKQHFLITHFFNPPRYMELLEIVGGEANPEIVNLISEFCEVKLGKGVVHGNDTPGFIANRIGCFLVTCWFK